MGQEMAGKIKIKIYTDSGHGWGAVKRTVLSNLGIANKITSFSFQKGNTVYLEEDCDLPSLITACAVKGIQIEFVQKHTDRRSPIRTYNRFVA